MSYSVGQEIYVLREYNLCRGILLSVGRRNLKVRICGRGYDCTQDVYVSPEKCADPNELIAVVWERWKGTNGRGGYRLERALYPHKLLPAKDWPFQKTVYEDSHGVLSAKGGI